MGKGNLEVSRELSEAFKGKVIESIGVKGASNSSRDRVLEIRLSGGDSLTVMPQVDHFEGTEEAFSSLDIMTEHTVKRTY